MPAFFFSFFFCWSRYASTFVVCTCCANKPRAKKQSDEWVVANRSSVLDFARNRSGAPVDDNKSFRFASWHFIGLASFDCGRWLVLLRWRRTDSRVYISWLARALSFSIYRSSQIKGEMNGCCIRIRHSRAQRIFDALSCEVLLRTNATEISSCFFFLSIGLEYL